MGLVSVASLALVATACSGDLPASVEEGTEVAVAWRGSLTSTNPASAGSVTDGNLDIASLTRGAFGTLIDDTVEMDETFGKVTMEGEKQARVRYDLAEPTWSDGVPIDTADLMLAWAATSGYFGTAQEGSDGTVDFGAVPTGLTKSAYIPEVDEGARAIEVPLVVPVVDWRTALDVAVPAHVVGQKALKIEDPIEAKEVVETAIEESDTAKLTKIAEAWKTAFTVAEDGKASEEALLSSGPYRIAKITAGEAGQEVDLEANPEYAGEARPTYEQVRLTPASADALASLGEKVDVVQVTPTKGNRKQVRDLERRDYGVETANDGTMWALILRTDRGLFKRKETRTSYLRAVPRGDIAEGGAGEWAEAYEATDVVLFPPGGEGYEIATEDSGFSTKFKASEDATAPRGARVCIAYDKSNAFASGAYDTIANVVDDEGWSTTDCGVSGADKVLSGNKWDAVLARIPIPQTPEEISAQWGSKGSQNATGGGDRERDRLISELARTADPYEARDVRVQIEKTLVADSIVVPIVMNPTVTVIDKKVDSVRPRSGQVAPLVSTIVEWSPTKK
ncbi:ABC transporter substrate-binding protein [Nocardioides sp. NBC_00368]|uniref:ABC transporter substrate-binding protein n=1 Tax=Nocardioides sp. NBC_00368 TaxID=2976000 RepID=UPI002E23AF71